MGLCFVVETRPFQVCLLCSFCSSDRGFALGFLQTPPPGGRPCPQLTVPTAKSVADFHRQVITRAERTHKQKSRLFSRDFCIIKLITYFQVCPTYPKHQAYTQCRAHGRRDRNRDGRYRDPRSRGVCRGRDGYIPQIRNRGMP